MATVTLRDCTATGVDGEPCRPASNERCMQMSRNPKKQITRTAKTQEKAQTETKSSNEQLLRVKIKSSLKAGPAFLQGH